MYKQVDTHKTAKIKNGAEISPVATLENKCGGRCHIWIDDHCYQVGLERPSQKQAEEGGVTEVYVAPTTYIFPEAFKVLKTLPDLIPA